MVIVPEWHPPSHCKAIDDGTVLILMLVVGLSRVPIGIVHWFKGVGPIPGALSVQATQFKARSKWKS